MSLSKSRANLCAVFATILTSSSFSTTARTTKAMFCTTWSFGDIRPCGPSKSSANLNFCRWHLPKVPSNF
ncbi:hypothetical protein PR002_g11197 [Phytophthora rubi]|uniref:Uncharacterized protein n=1 Tax=Phytophthora rubi TaxID=129364 RepID=A0A6A3MB00_9STRA|nr:hypothetical protein PR002_g11197 [Phytophthora rubi]